MKINRPSNKIFKLKINPTLLFIIIFIISFVFFNFTGDRSTREKISFNQVLRGIKNNEFSEVIAQNDGKINFKSKNILAIQKNTNPPLNQILESNSLNSNLNNFKNISLQELINLLLKQNFNFQFRILFDPSRSQEIITDIILDKNFIIALNVNSNNNRNILSPRVSSNSIKGFIVYNKDITVTDLVEEFEKIIKEYGIKISQLPLNIYHLANSVTYINYQAFVSRLENKHFEKIIELDDSIYAILNQDQVIQYYIDWNSNVASFINTLQEENIDFNSRLISVNTENIPPSITFSDILTILSLLAFGFLAYVIFKGAQSSGMGITQFGQSRAKIFFGSKTDTTFKDVAGIDEAKDELSEIVDFLKAPDKFRKLGARIPKGVLLVGPPGTGKTLLARAIAGEANVPFFHTSGSEFEEMLVGAGASRVRDLFAKAKRVAPALIFIDEIDAVARKRGTKIQSSTTEQTLNQILVEMDGFEKNTNLIVLAATNRPDVLDPAILRPGRFDRQIRIDIPDMEGRKQILEVHSKNKPLGSDVSLEKIAKRTVGFTGADLENILNEAAILAARQNKTFINMTDIEEAVSKVILGPAKKNKKRTEDELKLVAYHEAGHAIVSKFIPEATPVDKISIISRGRTGGVTLFIPEKDENIVSKRSMLAKICVLLGGRAAEYVALDDISTGASNDIERATALARHMVQKFGMSEKLGLVQYGDFEENEYLGYAYNTTKEYSDKTAQLIDEEVKRIIDESYNKAIQILKDNKDKLDKLATLLLEKEVISREEFESIF